MGPRLELIRVNVFSSPSSSEGRGINSQFSPISSPACFHFSEIDQREREKTWLAPLHLHQLDFLSDHGKKSFPIRFASKMAIWTQIWTGKMFSHSFLGGSQRHRTKFTKGPTMNANPPLLQKRLLHYYYKTSFNAILTAPKVRARMKMEKKIWVMLKEAKWLGATGKNPRPFCIKLQGQKTHFVHKDTHEFWTRLGGGLLLLSLMRSKESEEVR